MATVGKQTQLEDALIDKILKSVQDGENISYIKACCEALLIARANRK